MSYVNIKDWLIDKLAGVPNVTVVAYPSLNITSFPHLTIEASNSVGEYHTNRSIKRTINFNLHLYMSLADNVRGPEDGEQLFLETLDAIIALFDNHDNWHTTGTADLARINNITIENQSTDITVTRVAHISMSVVAQSP